MQCEPLLHVLDGASACCRLAAPKDVGLDAGTGSAKIWHTGSMTTPPAKPRLVPCHFTVEDLQLIEWACREKVQRARKDAKNETTPSSIEAFTSTAAKYDALALRIQRLKELGTR
jgi:hypothetical protein